LHYLIFPEKVLFEDRLDVAVYLAGEYAEQGGYFASRHPNGSSRRDMYFPFCPMVIISLFIVLLLII
jgi:hypothetical protein